MKFYWLHSRSVRKLRQNRMAMAALAVILAYLAIAIGVSAFGLITVEDTKRRVAFRHLPGFFAELEPEKRLDQASFYLEQVDRALEERRTDEDRSPEEVKARLRGALARTSLGNLHVTPKLAAGLEAIPVTGGRRDFADRLDELREVTLDAWTIRDDIYIELASGNPNLNERPDLWPKVGELEAHVAALFPEPESWQSFVRSFQLLLGTDRQGRSIMLRGVYSIKLAIQVGVITALIAVVVGALLGTAAAYFGGWVDHLVIWLYSTLSSIPYLVLLVLLAYMFSGSRFDGTTVPLLVAFSATFWIGPCRVIRGETMKLKELEYVQAATSVGFSRFYIMVRHILPNASHLMLINFSLLFIAAIKSEVILTFLGLGVKDQASWGIMISQSGSEVLNGFFWQIGAATAFMFVLVLAFNILSDALQDVFDPKHL